MVARRWAIISTVLSCINAASARIKSASFSASAKAVASSRLPPVSHTMPASRISSSTAEPSRALGRASARSASRWMVSTAPMACCRRGRRVPALFATLRTGRPWLYSSSSAFRLALARASRALARAISGCVPCWMGTISGKLMRRMRPRRQSQMRVMSAVASGVKTAAISMLLTMRVWL